MSSGNSSNPRASLTSCHVVPFLQTESAFFTILIPTVSISCVSDGWKSSLGAATRLSGLLPAPFLTPLGCSQVPPTLHKHAHQTGRLRGRLSLKEQSEPPERNLPAHTSSVKKGPKMVIMEQEADVWPSEIAAACLHANVTS